jgi:DNA-binding winged helix-turn-helix (wHTH) protein/TolB-like protein/tetratricopeptide (TPR) repeat protein
MTRPGTRYEFGDFALEVGQQQLLRRDGGASIPLSGKAFDTLLYLVEHPGQLLGKDALLQAVWPGVIVEENSLTQIVSTLRQLLGEARGENRYIATVSRKGYRFVAKVTQSDETAVPGVPATTAESISGAAPAGIFTRFGRRFAWVGMLVALIGAIAIALIWMDSRNPAPIAGQTLAILPFKPLLPAERNESLELGMTESLIASLARYSPRAISPLSSVRRFTALNQDAIAAGHKLGVDAVLEGSLQRRADRLRVSVRLLRVADGQQLWAQNFDLEFTSIFDVQDVIAERVAQALSVRWGGSASTRGAPYTQDPEAYARYVSGRFAWTRQTEASLLQSTDFYQQAIARDPNYALAYAGLADNYALLGVIGARAPNEVFPLAHRAIGKALSIDPNLAAAHSALGHILVQYDRDWVGAAREYALAVQLDPFMAVTHHRLGRLYMMQGDVERALAESARAQQLEPLWLATKTAVGAFLYDAERFDESIQIVEQVLALDDRADMARSILIRDLLGKGDYDRALRELDKRPLQAPGSNAFRAQALALSGRRPEAVTELHRLLKLSKERYVAAYDIALVYAALGDTENTFRWLEGAMADRSTLINFLAQDPVLDFLHADPRFAELVKRIGIYHRALRPAASPAV